MADENNKKSLTSSSPPSDSNESQEYNYFFGELKTKELETVDYEVYAISY